MNLPNKLTVLRMVMIPFFVFFMLMPSVPHHYLWAVVIFAAASFTDILDGKIARKYHLVTDFGKLMDPLADKMLVNAALVCFTALGVVSPVVVIIILGREFLVTSIRQIAAANGRVIAADLYGKVKTVFQMLSIIAAMILCDESILLAGKQTVIDVLMWITTALTVLSGANYVVKNIEIFRDVK